MDIPKTAVLIVSRSYSKCSNCGKETSPDEPSHTQVTGYTSGVACGATFTAITSDTIRLDDRWRATLAGMRPDLPIVEYESLFKDESGKASG